MNKMSRLEKKLATIILMVVCVGLVALVLHFFVYKPNTEQIEQLESQIVELSDKVEEAILGCKAYIKIGNSLTEPITTDSVIDETFWFTPMYRMGNLLTFMELFDETKNENFRLQEEITA